MSAPVESLTTPTTLPYRICAAAGTAATTKARTTSPTIRCELRDRNDPPIGATKSSFCEELKKTGGPRAGWRMWTARQQGSAVTLKHGEDGPVKRDRPWVDLGFPS